MSRIPGVESPEASFFTRFVYWMTKRKVGRVVLPVKIMGHHPRLLMGMGQMEQAQLAARSVPLTLKELAQIKTAMLIGCLF
jgi:hypothetical protein